MRLIVNIDVPELAPAIDFYTAALGLSHSRSLEGDVAELTGSSSVIYLLRNAAGTAVSGGQAQQRDYGRHWTAVHLDFVVDDLEAATRQALAAGAVQESECVEWRGSRCITFADPFGHGFCLIQFDADSYTNA